MKTQQLSIASVGTEIGFGYTRILQGLPLAVLVTAALLILMERLIFLADMPIDETPPLKFPNVHWEQPVTETFKTEKIQKPIKPLDPPPKLQPQDHRGDKVQISIPSIPVRVDQTHAINAGFGANLPIAQFLVQPRYPANALRKGLEGFVDVQFDVTEIGTTDNITVLGAQPQGVFEKAAVAAVARWKYQPKKIDDKPVRFEGLSNRIRFEMQK